MAAAPAFGGAAAFPSAPPAQSFEVQRLQKLRAVAQRLEIRPDFVSRLRALEGFSIAVICDDSGSMNTPVAAAPGASPFAQRATRWTELMETVSTVVELATCLADRGCDVWFLNRPPMMGVVQAQQVQAAFQHAPPQGFTPLTRTLQHVLAANREALRERKLLLLIATDGQPTDDAGNVNIPGFLQALQAKPATCFVQIMACTDVEADIAWLTKLDEESKGLDVIDDFLSERASILKAQGPNFKFSYGDYIVKALLGPSDEYFDTLDEVKGGCCSVA